MSELHVLEEVQPTAAMVSAPARSSPVDRYPYGWRDVLVTLPTGEQKWQRIPLTLQDVLHPQEEDILFPGDEHEQIRNYLYNVMSLLIDGNAQAVLLSDTNVDWGVPEVAPPSPGYCRDLPGTRAPALEYVQGGGRGNAAKPHH